MRRATVSLLLINKTLSGDAASGLGQHNSRLVVVADAANVTVQLWSNNRLLLVERHSTWARSVSQSTREHGWRDACFPKARPVLRATVTV